MNALPETGLDWRTAGLRYYSYNFFLRQKFGARVQKVSVDAGFTCPNVDGTVATGGCVFCDNRSFSPSRRLPRTTITGQINEGIRRLGKRYKATKYLAYFQPGTNTYAPVDRLRLLFDEALSHDDVVGLAIGTRADCLGSDVLALLDEIAQCTYLSVEIGMQTMHDRSLEWMNHGRCHADFLDAMARCAGRRFTTCTHLILGLPGESHEDMMATAREVSRLDVDAVKIHNLYAVKNTPLAAQVAAGEVALMEREEYVETVADFLEQLPANCVIERLSGDAPPDYLVGPPWCRDKPGVRQAIEQELIRRDSWQGRLCREPSG
jgi:radical SAM protein (TIGR01212 family)